jgi:hypothetical protein
MTLGKLAYESFEIFYSELMLVINPAIYTPPISVEKSFGPAISLLFFFFSFSYFISSFLLLLCMRAQRDC